MIQCPLCNTPVLLSDGAAIKSTLNDMATDDFYCPTYVHAHGNRRWSHYNRRTLKAQDTEYYAQIPPFRIHWQTNGELIVDKFTWIPAGDDPPNTDEVRFEKMYHVHDADFQEFLKIVNRFKLLVPFS